MLKPPKPFHLRAMRLSDINRVMAIEEVSFPTPWKASAYEYEITRNRLAAYHVLTVRMADKPEEVIGYSGYWLMSGEAHISTIATNPAWRGLGLGELLFLNILMLACSDAAYLATLEVRKGNKVAQSLYEKYQFQVVGERKRYYQGKEDAILMTAEPLDDDYRVFLRYRRRELFQKLEEIQAGSVRRSSNLFPTENERQ
jgi:ribosomal-protein-alanine N-acetyltransferase